ncbi:MAG: hypothetical protein ACRDLD_09535 [Thermoleophilaceae bacterium]
MSNLTLTIDAELLRRARIRALEQGTSVNAVVREYLASYAGRPDQTAARRRLLNLSDRTHAASRPGGREWRRDDLYEERAPMRQARE